MIMGGAVVMDALTVVLHTEQLNELYALRKAVFLPKWLVVNEEYWKDLRTHPVDADTPVTLAGAIMNHSYKHTPRETLALLSQQCTTYGLPSPGTWNDCVGSVQHIIDFHTGCHGDEGTFGDLGHTDHWKLYLYLGLFRFSDERAQDHMNIENADGSPATWLDHLYVWPGLRARQLVKLRNSIDNEYEYTDEDWGENDEWPFSMDADMNASE